MFNILSDVFVEKQNINIADSISDSYVNDLLLNDALCVLLEHCPEEKHAINKICMAVHDFNAVTLNMLRKNGYELENQKER